jgi:Fe-S-cluster-containing dehydrogenase component
LTEGGRARQWSLRSKLRPPEPDRARSPGIWANGRLTIRRPRMRLAFHFDQTRCIGCDTGVVACKDRHDVPAGPARWIRLKTTEKGKYPHPFMAFLVVPCYHCASSVCLAACLTGAIVKREWAREAAGRR